MSALAEKLKKALHDFHELMATKMLLERTHEFHGRLISETNTDDIDGLMMLVVNDAKISRMNDLLISLGMSSSCLVCLRYSATTTLLLLEEMDSKTTNEDKILDLIKYLDRSWQEMRDLRKQLEEVLAELQAKFEKVSQQAKTGDEG